jgi:hypothetical protein
VDECNSRFKFFVRPETGSLSAERASDTYMSKKRGNSNWGKPGMNVDVPAGPCSFDEIVNTLRLSPGEYEHSAPLKAWVKKNKDQKYVPPDLLQAWNLGVRD